MLRLPRNFFAFFAISKIADEIYGMHSNDQTIKKYSPEKIKRSPNIDHLIFKMAYCLRDQ